MKKSIALLLILIMLISTLPVFGASIASTQTYSTETLAGEIIIPVTEKTGAWFESTAVKNYDGGKHLWARTEGASVTFAVPEMTAGAYDVYYWVCPHYQNGETMSITVNHAGKANTLTVYQRIEQTETVAPGWVLMGTMDFSGDGSESIVHVCPGYNTRATAVKLVPAQKNQFIITGNAVYDTARVSNLATADGSAFKTYGRCFTSKGSDKFSNDTVSVHINVPAAGDYYVYSDVRSYDLAANVGSDDNRSFALDIVQKGKLQSVHKYNSTDRFWFGSFQGQTNGFVSNVDSGVCFVSPHTVHLEKGEAVLTLHTKNPWVGFSFIAFAEENSFFYNQIQGYEIDTSANRFYAENNLKIYTLGSAANAFYTGIVSAFADVTPAAAPQVTGVYDHAAKGAVLSVTDEAAEPVLGYILKNGEEYLGYYAKENASEISVNLSENTTITAYATDGAGNVSKASADAVLTAAEVPFATLEIENQNVLPQTFLYTTKAGNTFLTNRMTVKSGTAQNIFAAPIAGADTANLTTLLFADGFKPLREKTAYGASYTPKTSTYEYRVEPVIYKFNKNHEKNVGTFKGSGLEGYLDYGSHYCGDIGATAAFDCFIPVTGKYKLYYFVPDHPETGAVQYSWSLDSASGTLDALNNRGLIELGEYELTKGTKEFIIQKDYGLYLRASVLLIEPQFEMSRTTTEVFGFNTFAQKAVPNLSIIGTNDMTLSCVSEGEQVLWMLDMNQLLALKEEFPDGELNLDAVGAQIKVPYGELDLQTAYNAVADGENPVYLKVLMNRETVADARSALKTAAYVQCGENYTDTPELVRVSYNGIVEDAAVIAKIENGKQTVVATKRTPLVNDGTQNIQADIENQTVYAVFNELPALKAWDGDETAVTQKEFCDILYGVIGASHSITNTTDSLSIQKACTYTADALKKSGKRIITLADPETFLSDMFPDAGNIYSGYVEDVFITTESGVLRGNGVDNLDPYGTLTKDKAYDMLSAFIALPEFVSPIKENPEAWELVFSDEFNGTEINTDVWSLADGSYSTHIASLRSADDQIVEDGYLKLLIHKGEWERSGTVTNADGTKEPITYKGNWNTGHMWTKKSAFYSRYGYYEAMYRYPLGQSPSCNNSFWLMSQGGPYFEIDINEGRMPSKLQMNMHWSHYYDADGNLIALEGGRTQTGGVAYVPRNLSEKFHRYGLYWDTDKVIWYFDGEPLQEFALEGRGDFDVAVYFSVAIMKIHDEKGAIISPADFEAYNEEFGDLDGKSMDVEYVRVYQPVTAK